MALTVVIGPPAGGKSTWVQQRANPGDVVIDFDRIACALTVPGGSSHDHSTAVATVTRAARAAAVETALRHAGTADVYLIHSSPGAATLAGYRAKGAHIITIDPGRDVVRARCKSERPRRMFAVIDEWYRDHADGAHDAASPASPSVSRRW